MSTVKKIPVNSAKISGTHSNMPLYIKPSAMSGWGSVTLAEAQSMRFYSDAGLTTELAREIVSADEIHVKVSSVTTTTEIWCSYDGVASDYGVATSFGRNAVWSDYAGVYHMNDTSTTTFTDSTGNGNNATKGAANQPPEADGQVGKAQDFSGGSYEADIVDPATWRTHTAGTIQYWQKGVNNSAFKAVFSYGRSSDSNFFMYGGWDNANRIWFDSSIGSGNFARMRSNAVPTSNVWHSIAFQSSGSAYSMFLNGASYAMTVSTGGTGTNGRWIDPITGLNQPAIGYLNRASKAAYYNGLVDEVRVSSVQHSSNWLLTEYNNQSDVATFWGTVTDAGGAPVTNNGFMVFF